MERVLKLNGVAVVSTEFVINDKDHDEFFNAKTLHSDLLDHLISLQLVEPLDLRLSVETLETILEYYATGLYWHNLSGEEKNSTPHILLRRKNLLWTSIILVFKKMA